MNASTHLAWHETLDMHELVALQTISLIQLKRTVNHVQDAVLRNLYVHTIRTLESNLRELLAFYPKAPNPAMRNNQQVRDMETGFFAGNLLGMAKTMVRNYAIAITETSTPHLREVLTRQMLIAIQLHAQVFYFMLERNYYPSYDLNQLLVMDVQNAQFALTM
jgi:spore coat protein F